MTVATLEPGLAWMVMATVDGGRRRRQPGTLDSADAAVGGAAAEPPFAFPRFGGAIPTSEPDFLLLSLFGLKGAHDFWWVSGSNFFGSKFIQTAYIKFKYRI